MEIKILDIQTRLEYTVDLNNQGENKQVCPKCSKERKDKNKKLKCFSFNKQLNVGYCNHCTTKFGGKIDFKPVEKVTYKKPAWRNNTELSDKAIKWFESRKIAQKTLIDFKVTEGLEWMPQVEKEVNTIQFNYFRHGEFVNTKFRSATKDFKLVSGAELVFYNIDAIIGFDEVIICEGEIDCMTLVQCGFPNTISVPNGAGSNSLVFLDTCIDLFDDETKFLIAVDNDEAGLKLRNELVRRLGSEKCKEVTFLDCKDANECLIKYDVQTIISCIAEAKEFPINGVFTAKDIEKEIDDIYFNGMPKGSAIDIKEFDELLKFHKGYITTVTGIPGMGKSEVVDFLCTKLNLLYEWKFGIYSPENYPLELHFSKFAEKFIGKSFEIRNDFDRINKLELDLVKSHFNRNFFFIKPENDFSLSSILDTVKVLIRRNGINAFVLDAWNKIEHQYAGNESQYISKELDKLAMFCEINNVHLFLVAHPTKMIKDKKTGEWEIPTLYSINGSANFYNKTHNGIVVGRDKNTGLTEIHIQKVKFKHWGKEGMLRLSWNKYNGRYYSGYPDNSNWLLSPTEQLSLIPEPPKMQPNHNFDTPMPTSNMRDEPYYREPEPKFIIPTTPHVPTDNEPF